MPEWTQIVIGAAALFGASALLWVQVVKPLIRLGADTKKLEERVEDLEKRVGPINGKEPR